MANGAQNYSSGFLAAIFLGVLPFAAWFQHLCTCFTTDRWGTLIAGAIFFPIGVIHGFGIWFGFCH